VICTRGSSEAIILSLVLAVIYFFQQGAVLISGVLYGFAVHFKPYTVPFCLPLYLASSSWSSINHEDWNWKTWLKEFLTIGPTRIKLIMGSVIGFGVPTLVCYYIYGYEFLHETYFYHLTRKDIKHNFSLYFYLLYLNADNEGILLKLASFLPQVILLVSVAFLYPSRNDLCFTLFVQTYFFVIFNKVSTSQYFLWYLSFLPVLGSRFDIKWTHAGVLVMVWYFAQLSWLLPAYYLEFEGRNTFFYIWLESIAFFCGNIGILTQLIKSYKSLPIQQP
jgi:phosphatidylinositol glycan class M